MTILILTAEFADGTSRPVNCAGSIAEAKELAQSHLTNTLKRHRNGQDVMPVERYMVWKQNSEGAYQEEYPIDAVSELKW